MKFLCEFVLICGQLICGLYAWAGEPLRIVKQNNTYFLEVADSLLGRDLLFGSRVVNLSVQKNISAGQTMSDPIVVRFVPNGKYLNMERRISNAVWDEADVAAELIARNHVIPVMQVFDLVRRDESRGVNVIDVTRYFNDEISELSPLPGGMKQGKLESKASGIVRFSNHENRVNVTTRYAYVGGKTPLVVTINYTLLVLPREPMRPRYEDERMGYFSSVKTVYNTAKRVYRPKYVSRWRIEPRPEDVARYQAGELVEPARPIVFYFDPATPELIKKYARLGILDWNKAFEAIGFKNAIQVRDFPGEDFNSEDLTVSCFRYIPTEEANAAGRIWTDPRSGEIIQADILWYHNVVRLLQEWRFIQTAAADPRARNKELSEEIMGELIRYAVAHETGHTLGMKHNMRASFAYPVDSLRSPSFTRKYGTTASIMDYARNNYVAQPGDFERGVKMTPPILGPFDYFSVQWAYTPIFDVKTPEEELPVLDRMFREKGHDPLYLYANMAMGPVVPDPSGQSDMLGDDLLKSSTYGILNLQYIMSHLIDWCSDEGGSYDRMIEMYDAGVKQFFKYMNNCASYIGGGYYFPGTVGQYEARHVEVDKEQQKKAVQFIVDELQESEQWLCDRRLFDLIGNKTETLMNRQGEMLATLVSPNLLSRLIGSVYPIEEYLQDISTCLFPDKKSWSEYEKNRQIAYVLALKKINDEKGGPGKANDYLKRTAVHVEIVRLSKKLERQVKYSEHIGFIMDLLKR
jgi:hypothetical protein